MTTYYAGKPFLIKLGLDGAGGTLTGTKTLNLKINNVAVDVSNKSTGGWQELMEGAGLQSIDISIDGLVNDSTAYTNFKGYAQSQTVAPFQIVYPDNSTVSLYCLISNFSESGGYNDPLAFSATLNSSSVPTFG